MSGVDGPDTAAVYQLLTEVARRVAGHDDKFDAQDRKLDDLAAGLASLREVVTYYHSSVIGHGILINELDERIRRIERHLKLEPAGGGEPGFAPTKAQDRAGWCAGRGRLSGGRERSRRAAWPP